MRTLLALTGLMLLLAGAVWWKTRPGDTPTNLPPTTSENPLRGVSTLGVKEDTTKPRNRMADTEFPSTPKSGMDARPSDAGGDHEATPIPAVIDPTPPVDPAPPAFEPEPEPTPDVNPVPAVGVRYTVQSGDTLYRIVVNHYGTAPEALVDAVAEANGMRDAGSLGVGQVLELPLVSGFPGPKRP